MRSKNSKPLTEAESFHLEEVKSLPCSLCDAPPPVEAHHIRQGDHWTTVALCKDCHTGRSGIHGDKVVWKIMKLDELGALNITLKRLLA